MPGNAHQDKRLNNISLAFEYVAGTLPDVERAIVNDRLARDVNLQREIRFWEAHLMGLQNRAIQLPPKPGVWQSIATRINNASGTRTRQPSVRRWWISGALAAVLVAFILVIPQLQPEGPNTDYVAILTDATGDARLTALTTARNQKMWLQWHQVALAEGTSLQLWAVSRRDGQTRPIAIFGAILDQSNVTELPLSDAEWRLIQDARLLLLTEEEAGGSPLDEPSESVVAKGVCVRFQAEPSTKSSPSQQEAG